MRVAADAASTDVLPADALRYLGRQSVLERRAGLARVQSSRRVNRRPPRDARAARCSHATGHDRVVTATAVLGNGIRLGYESARSEGGAGRPSRALGGRGPLPDVAGRRQRRCLVQAPGRSATALPVPVRLLHRRRTAQASLEAFRFPFVAFRVQGGVSVWGRTPSGTSSVVVVQRRAGGGWVTLARLRASRNGIFSSLLRVPTAATDSLRARLAPGSESSIPFSLTVPPSRRVSPFGCGGPIPC